ncbi:MAG: metallophosphoesterase [Anaerolineae bacterium]|jgi:predicted MPP superfamily phosphohydrolase|nr:metallophosphoesterase [Anaerolineae bacterium]
MRKNGCAFAVLSGMAIAALMVAYAFVEPYWLRVRHLTVADVDVPPAFHGTRIAFLSDIHHGPFFSLKRVRRVVDIVNGLRPDIILLGGDYVHRDARYIAPVFAELARLRAPLGVFAVAGNHDDWEGIDETRAAMARAGIVNLDNRAAWITMGGDRIRIGGVGDLWEDAHEIAPTLDGVRESDFVILLSHNPDFAEQIQTDGIDLVLSGHTHGGQVTLFGLWATAVPSAYGQKYRSGFVRTEHTLAYVTTGVGTITPPVRFCARPEVVLITLERR